MSKRILAVLVVLCGALALVDDADAKRLGGGRSLGSQRSMTSAPPASAPARPAQQQAAPQNAAGAAAQPPAPASAFSRWMPLLGGLALGGLLGSLFGGSGLGGLVLMALLALVVVALVRGMVARRPADAPQLLRTAGPDISAVEPAPEPPAASTAAAPRIPAGFDTAGFLRSAKMNFMRLQAAHDRGSLEEIRELTTQDMYEALRRDMAARAGSAQQTDVLDIGADLLELATERGEHWAAVRFSGTVREAPGQPAEGFEEVWNLVKPADGSSGWLLAGIQQMH